MEVFEGLKPEAVWGYFEEICQVPRPSKKEGKNYRLFIGLGGKAQFGSQTG